MYSFGSFAAGLIIVAASFVVGGALVGATRKRKTIRTNARTMIILGSGGHTTEIMSIVGCLDTKKYWPRCYVIAQTDKLSEDKARTFESKCLSARKLVEPYCAEERVTKECYRPEFLRISRSREVGQSYITSVYSTVRALLEAFALAFRFKPDLLLCNGPGTCIPLCLACHILKLLGLLTTTVVYVESIARVKSLSLTGKLLYHLRMTDRFFVQWEGLAARYPRSSCPGRVM